MNARADAPADVHSGCPHQFSSAMVLGGGNVCGGVRSGGVCGGGVFGREVCFCGAIAIGTAGGNSSP